MSTIYGQNYLLDSSVDTGEWLSRFRPASFRGVKFHVDSTSISGGRRKIVIEYPTNDLSTFQDVGKKTTKIDLVAYVVKGSLSQEEYDKQRDKLIQALEGTSAKGRLILNTYQVDIVAVVDSFTVVETVSDGGMARFNISFYKERESLIASVSRKKPLEKLQAAKELSYAAATRGFVERYTNNQQLKKAFNRIEHVIDVLNDVSNAVAEAKMLFAPVAEFKRMKSIIDGKIIAITLGVEDFIKTFRDMIDFGTDRDSAFPLPPDKAIASLKRTLGVLGSFSFSSTLSEEDKAIATATGIAVIASVSTGLQFVTFKTKDETQELRDLINKSIDTVNSLQLENDEYAALQDMRAAMTEYLADKDVNALPVKNITLVESLPSLALSNMLYSEIDSEQDIIDRNKIRNPMFVNGGVPLKVVSNG